MEGDLVILSTVSSKAVESSRHKLTDRHDEECRVNYVAVTRARENLLVVDDGGKFSLELPA
jgi:superfamily I DNA/RNA helicase